MLKGLYYLPLFVAGLVAVAWGFPAAHRLKRPWDIAAAVIVLLGVALFASGLLLMIIPDFLR